MKRSEFKERKRQRKSDIKTLRELHYSDDEIEEYINAGTYKLALRKFWAKRRLKK